MKKAPVVSLTRLLLTSLLFGLFIASPALAADPVEVDAKYVKEMMDSGQAVVIFPLSPIEFNNLHIKGSVNLPMAQLPDALPADKNQPLAFYCLGRT